MDQNSSSAMDSFKNTVLECGRMLAELDDESRKEGLQIILNMLPGTSHCVEATAAEKAEAELPLKLTVDIVETPPPPSCNAPVVIQPEQPVKRKRGRPRIHPVKDTTMKRKTKSDPKIKVPVDGSKPKRCRARKKKGDDDVIAVDPEPVNLATKEGDKHLEEDVGTLSSVQLRAVFQNDDDNRFSNNVQPPVLQKKPVTGKREGKGRKTKAQDVHDENVAIGSDLMSSEQLSEHVCTACSKTFFHYHSFSLHLKKHVFSPIACLICRGQFSNELVMRSHACNVSGVGAGYVPATNNVKLTTTGEQGGGDTKVMKKEYQCENCMQMFGRLVALHRHRVYCRDAEDPRGMDMTHECPQCDMVRTQDMMEPECCHIIVMFCCRLCPEQFHTALALMRHDQTAHTTTVSQPPANSKRFMCSQCGKMFGRKASLQRHLTVHTDYKPFHCPHCEFSCREQSNLQRHMEYHFSHRRFSCTICGASFHAKKTLETHHTYKHTEERKYRCSRCEMTFKTNNSLQRHERTHDTEKEHKCSRCAMAFHRFYNLRRHMTMVHKDQSAFPPVRKLAILDELHEAKQLLSVSSSLVDHMLPAQQQPLFHHHHQAYIEPDDMNDSLFCVDKNLEVQGPICEPFRAGGTIPNQQLHTSCAATYNVTSLYYSELPALKY